MKRLLLTLAILLGGVGLVSAQSGGSSAAGGGLSTKAILALEECFDDFDTFICTGGGGGGVGGSGTTDMIPVWTAATTLGDSNLTDNGTSLSGTYGGTISLSATGDVTLSSSDEIFLTATADVNIPDDVPLVFGSMATSGGPGSVTWNTFGGAGFERLEIDGEGNAGVLVTHGNGTTGGFIVADGGGSFVHTLTQNPPAGAGGSLPSWIFFVDGPTSMDDAGDQRIGIDLEMESGTSDVAGSQQIGLFIEAPIARASTQDAVLFETGGWDNDIVKGTETVRTALNFATPSGANVVTIPASTGTILLDTDIAVSGTLNTISKFTPSGTALGDSTITDDGTVVTITGSVAGETIKVGSDNTDGIELDAAGEEVFIHSSGGTLTVGEGDEEYAIEVDSIDGTIADNMGYSTAFGFVVTANGNGPTSTYTHAAPPATNLSGAVWTMASSFNPMNGSDRNDGLFIDLTNPNHTGTGNTLNGILIDGITADADALEIAISIQDGWDEDIHFEDATATVTYTDNGTLTLRDDGGQTSFIMADLPSAAGSGDAVTLSGTLGIMDGSDTIRGTFVDLANANHTGTGNLLVGADIDGITGDADATEVAQRVGSGWDYSEAWTVLSASPPNLSANEVGFFIDESTDRVATATADCALVARLSDGTEINVAILVTDGGCP